MPIDYTEIILALIGLLSLLVTTVLVPLIKARTTVAQLEKIKFWTDIAVTAAEKHFESQPGMGEVKKQEVIDFIQSLNIKLTDEQLSLLIDAVVEELINKPLNELNE